MCSFCIHYLHAVVVAVGQILLLKLLPGGGTLIRRKIGIFIHNVLIFVHAAAIGYERERFHHVGIAVLHNAVAEEQPQPRIRKVFHGHGVYLVHLTGAPAVFGNGLMAAGAERFKRMARLVRKNAHIRRGAVEVGEYIR